MRQLSPVTNRYFCRQKFKIPYHPHFNTTQRSYIQAPSHASLLHDLKELKPLQQVHAHVVTSGLSHNIFIYNRLVNSYASCGLMTDAETIFRAILRKNVVSWTILVSGFTKNDLFIEAIDVFRDMIISGFDPNEVTISSILPAFGNLGLTQMGKSVHCFWVRCGFEANVFVETSLVNMYSKFGFMGVARNLFENMPERNVVSWNAIISGYSDNGYGEEALMLFNLMRRQGFSIDYFTIMSLVSASLSLGFLLIGAGSHGFTIRTGYENDHLVKTALLDAYVNNHCTDDAYLLFNEMPVKDVVAWTLMLTGFSSGGYLTKAIEHFNEMMSVEKLELDYIAFMTILSSCSHSGAFKQGRRIHGLTIKTGFVNYTFVGSAIIDMYANCGDLENAISFFEGMEEKDVVCWNAMVAGFGMNGYGNDAIDLFLRMKGSGVHPSESTFVCLLSACSHAGMVDQGLHIFNHMAANWRLVPNLQHYACVVDLLGRAGRLIDAHSLIDNMPLQPDSGVYGALFGACRVQGNIEMGLEMSQELFKLEPNDVGYYILLLNMFALVGDWEGVEMTRGSLRSKGLKKDPGFSSIEINHEVCTFMAGDKDHSQYIEIDSILKVLILQIKQAGYLPDRMYAFQDASKSNDERWLSCTTAVRQSPLLLDQ